MTSQIKKGIFKPHLVKDMLSKEWAAIHDIFKGFGPTPKEALDELRTLKNEVEQDPFGL